MSRVESRFQLCGVDGSRGGGFRDVIGTTIMVNVLFYAPDFL